MLNESYAIYLPADCTGEFQPIDISMNNPVKTLLKDEIGIYVEFLPKLMILPLNKVMRSFISNKKNETYCS